MNAHTIAMIVMIALNPGFVLVGAAIIESVKSAR